VRYIFDLFKLRAPAFTSSMGRSHRYRDGARHCGGDSTAGGATR